MVADLNTPNTSTVLRTEGEDILTGKRPLSSSERRHAEFLPFTDLWTAVHGASDKGYTLRCGSAWKEAFTQTTGGTGLVVVVKG